MHARTPSPPIYIYIYVFRSPCVYVCVETALSVLSAPPPPSISMWIPPRLFVPPCTKLLSPGIVLIDISRILLKREGNRLGNRNSIFDIFYPLETACLLLLQDVNLTLDPSRDSKK